MYSVPAFIMSLLSNKQNHYALQWYTLFSGIIIKLAKHMHTMILFMLAGLLRAFEEQQLNLLFGVPVFAVSLSSFS